MMGGVNRLTKVEKYDVDGILIETLPSLVIGR